MGTAYLRYQNSFTAPSINPLWLLLLFGVLGTQNLFLNSPIFARETAIVPTSSLGSIVQREIPAMKMKQLDIEHERQRWKADTGTRYKNYKMLPVTDGVIHVQLVKYLNSRPIKINIVEINRKINPDLMVSPKLASVNSNLKQKATIRTIAKNNNSIVAINGTYFKPANGVPLGTLMIDRKLYTGPIYERVAMGIFDDGYKMARVSLNGKLTTANGEIKVDNVNQPRMLSSYTLAYTKEWGQLSPPAPKYGVLLGIKNNEIKSISTAALKLADFDYVISAPAGKLNKVNYGEQVTLDINTTPDWSDVTHIISGGPYLVKNGTTYVDVKEQKLNSVNGKNPRTAIGYTADNNLVLVTIDGREQNSVGMTLFELAKFMKDIGCVDAMNLDGGGSSVMYVNGKIVNSPAQTGGIAISNALVISKNEVVATNRGT